MLVVHFYLFPFKVLLQKLFLQKLIMFLENCMYDTSSGCLIYFFNLNSMNENLIILNQPVVNTVFPEWNFLANEELGLWNLIFVLLGRKDKIAMVSVYPNNTVILVRKYSL